MSMYILLIVGCGVLLLFSVVGSLLKRFQEAPPSRSGYRVHRSADTLREPTPDYEAWGGGGDYGCGDSGYDCDMGGG
jgi:hypothetical protein